MNSMALASVTINKLFFIIKRPRFSKNSFYCTSIFLKGFFVAKKLEREFLNKFALFFVGFLSFFPINKQSISFSKILAI
jgi:hypothetical protein